jgi:hypothetical protein
LTGEIQLPIGLGVCKERLGACWLVKEKERQPGPSEEWLKMPQVQAKNERQAKMPE